MKRSYGQYCGVARALDVLGERWTLLVVRELIVGPRRYKDLLATLPGIGTNLLAARLKELEADGIVRRRTLPPPAGSIVYELTPFGRRLEPIVLELGRWGRTLLPDRAAKDERYLGRWLTFALYANYAAEEARGVRETYELKVGDEVVHARVDDGRLELGEGPADQADLVLEAPLELLMAIERGKTDLLAARRSGRLRVRGSEAALRRFARIFPPSA